MPTTLGRTDSEAVISEPSEAGAIPRTRSFWRPVGEYKKDNLTILAAASTYYALSSVVPGLIV
jgi:uncharacterized BrkB/YihY/UPF0761 family membrane protein